MLKFLYLKKIKIYFFCVLFCFVCCCSGYNNQNTNVYHKKLLKNLLSVFNKQTPNYLYSKLGKPNLYDVIKDKNGKIKYAYIVYDYVYNFDIKRYDCQITFKTNKQQNKIVDITYSNDKCCYIVMY